MLDYLYESSREEIKQGYIFRQSYYICLNCGKEFEKGFIYKIDERFADAETAMKVHIDLEHEGVFQFLLNLDKRLTGLSEQQKKLLLLMYEEKSDEEIAKTLELSSSTVRNHRFALREKGKQAHLFSAVMEMAEERLSKKQKQTSTQKGVTMTEERYVITESEKVLKSYFNPDGTLKIIPPKEKKRLIILRKIAELFDETRKYSEKEVNEILIPIYEDHVQIRRNMIEYGFMNRLPDGSAYWIVTEKRKDNE